ncbi:Sensors of blue-light using FAD [Noviherbaspirillum humi]|uniref:Sensors of blue-light using FAD n=1 Tax=Noviherbaspirillum humi TaxID=1688639 RepID=A0A239IGR9_9BURK|nr:BLUF domain-containing protein [Noviherbaspirillum humi]SNS91614.1 Sensors of blue-light using FAD [Noviherbaspirillum humi]
MLFTLSYISQIVGQPDGASMSALLAVSERNNRQRGITGMLTYGAGSFLQTLEGPENEVLALYDRIRRDPRHCDVTEIMRQTISERAFPDKPMAAHRLFRSTDFLLSVNTAGKGGNCAVSHMHSSFATLSARTRFG